MYLLCFKTQTIMLKFCTALTVPAFMLYFIEDEHGDCYVYCLGCTVEVICIHNKLRNKSEFFFSNIFLLQKY